MEAVLDQITTLDPDKDYETYHGIPEKKTLAGALHGGVGARLLVLIGHHALTNELGTVYGPDTTFNVEGQDRLPDVSFVSVDRLPAEGEPLTAWDFAPDLAVEVVSPNDIYQKLMNKVFDYLDAGVQEVWLIAPESKTVTIYYSFTDVKILTERDVLTCEKLLPGFRCLVGDLFKLPKRIGKNSEAALPDAEVLKFAGSLPDFPERESQGG
jgi:Uma2 family endonuclease